MVMGCENCMLGSIIMVIKYGNQITMNHTLRHKKYNTSAAKLEALIVFQV